jgi:hypothetical protein
LNSNGTILIFCFSENRPGSVTQKFFQPFVHSLVVEIFRLFPKPPNEFLSLFISVMFQFPKNLPGCIGIKFRGRSG